MGIKLFNFITHVMFIQVAMKFIVFLKPNLKYIFLIVKKLLDKSVVWPADVFINIMTDKDCSCELCNSKLVIFCHENCKTAKMFRRSPATIKKHKFESQISLELVFSA